MVQNVDVFEMPAAQRERESDGVMERDRVEVIKQKTRHGYHQMDY